MIKFIQAEDTLPLRSLVLRNGAPLAEAKMEEDLTATTFHLGYFNEAGELLCILTCQQQTHAAFEGAGYRLRGMATHPDARQQGLAKQLLLAAIQHLKEVLNVDYLWFNARVVALPFYEKLQFEYLSTEFDIPGIGPHREMGMRF
ncbi:GNAT family N-acetyltransferase [Sphingobacteriaceae bacterium WQ 2009]|uniref:GNAT family N-acetyltransferase n=1 Tax=Rhinopithecimicrobium faecis TaxID=2820698 RepID=A0A8T4HAG6_9SPHI|nr:GNAT family N-acetyltransferase [Sphingobacteriaceae bacterium WQ 2009]